MCLGKALFGSGSSTVDSMLLMKLIGIHSYHSGICRTRNSYNVSIITSIQRIIQARIHVGVRTMELKSDHDKTAAPGPSSQLVRYDWSLII